MVKINELPENMPLTTIVRHTLKLGTEKDFKKWVQAITEKASAFKGFKGIYVVAPKVGVTTNEYIVVFKFDQLNNLLVWMNSNDRKLALKEIKLFSEKEMELEYQEGINFWFTTPETETKAPPKWKIATLTWVAVFPMVILLLEFYGRLLPSFPLSIKVLFVSLTLVSLLTWVLMPALTKLFKRWLF